MNTRLKLFLKIAGGFFAFILLLYLGVAAYVSINKKEILKSITTQLNENINGRLTIESMEPALLRGLPGVSITLSNVVVRDSLWSTHGKDLLRAKEIYVAIDVLALLRRAVRIRDVNIHNGAIYLFTDSAGYSNTNLFLKKKTPGKMKNEIRLNHLHFSNVSFVFENHSKSKLFRFDNDKLKMELNYSPVGWTADVGMNMFVKNLSFNTGKGSYIKDKRLMADMRIQYDRSSSKLTIPQQKIKIGQEDIAIGGQFDFTLQPTTFVLNIHTDNIIYKNAKTLLTESIAAKLNSLDFKQPVDIGAAIVGSFRYRDTPLVTINWRIRNNTCITAAGEVNCSFTGSFMNELIPGNGRNDRNSVISISGFDGTWQGIPVKVDTMRITNLTNPVLEGKFRSRFPLTKLNAILGSNVFNFDGGTADLDLLYKGGINDDDTTPPYVYGTVNVRNAAMTYLPRGLSFADVAATLKFMGSDLLIQNVKVKKGANVLSMDGSIRNFLNLYYYAPGKMWLDWHIKSPLIDLNEFKSFLTARKLQNTGPRKSSFARINRLSGQLDEALDESNVHMLVEVNKVIYKNFTASDINAEINLLQKGITLQNISLKHAGGSLKVTGSMNQQGTVNQVALKTSIVNVKVNEFFRAFDNFGQETLTDKNIKGALSANVNVTGGINDMGQVLPKSFEGTASFELKDGALSDFEPLMDIGKFVFRKRHLEHITFNTIKNKVDIHGDKFTIYPMRIESSVINMNVAGVYALGKGTDIRIDVQLRNPKKDELITDEVEKQARGAKGMQLHLQATDGDDGKVSIKLKLNNKAGKQRKKDEES